MDDDIQLSLKDYRTILQHYEVKHDGLSKTILREKSEQIINDKLCKCIKKVKKTLKTEKEQQPIAFCSKSILKNRNLKYYGFRCGKPGTRTLLPYYYKTKDPSKHPVKYKLTKQHRSPLKFNTTKKKRRKNTKIKTLKRR